MCIYAVKKSKYEARESLLCESKELFIQISKAEGKRKSNLINDMIIGLAKAA